MSGQSSRKSRSSSRRFVTNKFTLVGPHCGANVVVGGFSVFERKLLDRACDELLVKEIILKEENYPDMMVP